MKIESLAALKRYLKENLGSSFSLENYKLNPETKEPFLYWNPGTRKLNHVNSVSFGFETVKDNGSICTSYCYYPKASDCIFIHDSYGEFESFRINSPSGYLIYKLVKA